MSSRRLLLAAWILCWASAPASVWASDLYWYDSNVSNGRIRHCDLASCVPSNFATAVDVGLDGDMAIDPLEQMIYWKVNGTTGSQSKVQRMSLSGGAVQDIFSVNSSITGMAIDPVARHVYLGTPSASTRIQRYSIDAPTTPTPVVAFNEVGCSSCSPQGLALDLAGGFLYWADQTNGKIARKALALSTPIEDVVTSLSQPSSLALDLVNDRVYFSQTLPSRISYALLSSPTTLADLVNPVSDPLYAGCLERDPSPGGFGEMYVALSGAGEIRHCSIDAGCPSLTLLDDGLTAPRGLALLPSVDQVPALGPLGVTWLVLLLALVVAWLSSRGIRRA